MLRLGGLLLVAWAEVLSGASPSANATTAWLDGATTADCRVALTASPSSLRLGRLEVHDPFAFDAALAVGRGALCRAARPGAPPATRRLAVVSFSTSAAYVASRPADKFALWPALVRGRTVVLRRRFNVGLLEAMPKRKAWHALSSSREMIARPNMSGSRSRWEV